MIEKALFNYQWAKATTNTDETLITWLQAFDREDDALMLEAIENVFLYCKNFPTVAHIKEQVDALKMKTHNVATPALDRPKHYDIPIIARVMDMMRKGETAKFVAEMTVEPEITAYARSKFPNISDELVRKNYLEILQAYEGNNKCLGCLWTFGDCNDRGHYPVMSLQPNGYISLTWQRCQKGAK